MDCIETIADMIGSSMMANSQQKSLKKSLSYEIFNSKPTFSAVRQQNSLNSC